MYSLFSFVRSIVRPFVLYVVVSWFRSFVIYFAPVSFCKFVLTKICSYVALSLCCYFFSWFVLVFARYFGSSFVVSCVLYLVRSLFL